VLALFGDSFEFIREPRSSWCKSTFIARQHWCSEKKALQCCTRKDNQLLYQSQDEGLAGDADRLLVQWSGGGRRPAEGPLTVTVYAPVVQCELSLPHPGGRLRDLSLDF
jgi:hypothetical protein